MSVLLSVLAVMAVVGTGLWAMQRRLIYFPDGTPPPLAVVGPGWEEVALATDDGLTLRAWFRPPTAQGPVVLVFNGNAGNRGDRATLGTGLAGRGFGVLLTDYRGYGGNPGHPTETGLASDARAALAFLRGRTADNPIVYFGESLGAAVAVELAAAEPPAALVLRSPFMSLVDVGRTHYPWLPVGLLLKDRYPTGERVGRVAAPTLVIAGSADAIVPAEQSRAVYAAAPDPKELVVLDGADHNDAALVAGPTMLDAVARFVAEATDGEG